MSEEEDSSSSSIILAAKFGSESLNVIRSVEKNLLLVIFILIPLVAFAILDTLEVFKQINIHDIIIVILSIILTIISVSLYWFSRKSKYTLHRWAKMFEEKKFFYPPGIFINSFVSYLIKCCILGLD